MDFVQILDLTVFDRPAYPGLKYSYKKRPVLWAPNPVDVTLLHEYSSK